MSKPTAEQANAAYERLQAAAFHPVFFAQLKQAGYVPRDPEEAAGYLRLGQHLLDRHQQAEAEAAVKQGSVLAHALADHGLAAGGGGAELDRAYAKTAAALMADPAVAGAAADIVRFYDA